MRLPYLDVSGRTQLGHTAPLRGHSKGKSTMFTGERGSYSYSTKCVFPSHLTPASGRESGRRRETETTDPGLWKYRRADPTMFDRTSGMQEVNKESRWKQTVSPAQADKFFARLQSAAPPLVLIPHCMHSALLCTSRHSPVVATAHSPSRG
jgi:hypothetical protein